MEKAGGSKSKSTIIFMSTEALMGLAMEWRAMAERINEKYRDQSPVTTRNVVMALEMCAEELEEIVSQKGAKSAKEGA